jgi:hypothetical protein
MVVTTPDDYIPPHPEAPAPHGAGGLLQVAPGLVRLAALSGWRLFEWVLRTSADTGGEIVRALASGTFPTDTIVEIASNLRAVGRQALGLPEDLTESPMVRHTDPMGLTSAELSAMGAELLYRSADVWFTEDIHPAYERILEEMAPDEARILRFLAIDGPQPAIDVRTGRLFGIGSELIAGGLSMIGLRAGVRLIERTNAYQNNLFRLGLIWFSREEVEPSRYQVVEVQPEVAEAIKRAGRFPRIVRRSIHLTPFGEDFCRTCLPLGDDPRPPQRG